MALDSLPLLSLIGASCGSAQFTQSDIRFALYLDVVGAAALALVMDSPRSTESVSPVAP